MTTASAPARVARAAAILSAVAALFVAGNVVGWSIKRKSHVDQQRQVIRQVEQLGGTYYYDYQLQADGSLSKKATPSWVGQITGIDWWHDLFYVTFAEFKTNEQGQPIATSRATITDDFLLLASQLDSIRWLALNGTAVSDSGIEQLCARLDLERVWLGQTKIGDKAAAALARCQSLELLALEATEITDLALGQLAQLPNLQTLSLGSRYLTPTGLEQLGKLQRLKELRVDFLPVTDDAVAQLDALQELETLSLQSTAIGNGSGEYVSKLSALKWLNLSGTDIDGRFFGPDFSLPQLEQLIVSRTAVQDDDLNWLAGCESFMSIDGRNTACTVSGLCELLRRGRAISLDRALLMIADATMDGNGRLTSLDLAGYTVGDEDVGLLGELPKLQWLKLPANRLTAAGYQELAGAPLPQLALLDVSYSALDGQGLRHLLTMEQLLNLHIEETLVTDQEVQQAQTGHPKLMIYHKPLRVR